MSAVPLKSVRGRISSHIVVMGVSGSGKSTVAEELAQALGLPFCEGDALHPPASVAKMHEGVPLEDRDRAPWLARCNSWLCAHSAGGVISCSALKRSYRDRLRTGLAETLCFVFLDPPRDVLMRRLARRARHFMPASLLDSQLATLERPAADEHVVRLTDSVSVSSTMEAIMARLAAGGCGAPAVRR